MTLNGNIFTFSINGFCNPLRDSELSPPFNTRFARGFEYRGGC